MIILITVSFLC